MKKSLKTLLWPKPLKPKTRRAGDTLIEVTIALAILSMVLIASAVAATNAYRMGQTARERTTISNAAQGQMEALRAFRDAHDWSQFLNGGTSPSAYPGVLSAAVGQGCKVKSPCLHMRPMTGNTFVPANGTLDGPVPTSYIEMNVTPGPLIAGMPTSVTVVINYGSEAMGGGEPIKGHIQTTLTNTAYAAPTPIPPPPPPCSGAITDIVLILDVSSSMGSSFGSGNRMDASKATATGFVESVNLSPSGNHVSIVKFDGSTSAVTGLTGSLTTAKSAISGLRTGSGTKYVPPLRLARSILDNGRQNVAKVVVFVSDGEAHDTESQSTTYQMVQTEMSILEATGTKVYTIGIGDDDRMDLLLQIMPRNGGISGTANEPNRLKEIYTNIAGELTCL